MLLVAVDDRKARIEVGYGLEPILPDALAGRVLDEKLFPSFKKHRYAEGLNLAVNRIAEIIERGEPAKAVAPAANQAPDNSYFIPILLFLIITAYTICRGLWQRFHPAPLTQGAFGRRRPFWSNWDGGFGSFGGFGGGSFGGGGFGGGCDSGSSGGG